VKGKTGRRDRLTVVCVSFGVTTVEITIYSQFPILP